MPCRQWCGAGLLRNVPGGAAANWSSLRRRQQAGGQGKGGGGGTGGRGGSRLARPGGGAAGAGTTQSRPGLSEAKRSGCMCVWEGGGRRRRSTSLDHAGGGPVQREHGPAGEGLSEAGPQVAHFGAGREPALCRASAQPWACRYRVRSFSPSRIRVTALGSRLGPAGRRPRCARAPGRRRGSHPASEGPGVVSESSDRGPHGSRPALAAARGRHVLPTRRLVAARAAAGGSRRRRPGTRWGTGAPDDSDAPSGLSSTMP